MPYVLDNGSQIRPAPSAPPPPMLDSQAGSRRTLHLPPDLRNGISRGERLHHLPRARHRLASSIKRWYLKVCTPIRSMNLIVCTPIQKYAFEMVHACSKVFDSMHASDAALPQEKETPAEVVAFIEEVHSSSRTLYRIWHV